MDHKSGSVVQGRYHRVKVNNTIRNVTILDNLIVNVKLFI